jgi:hypothetical protein
MRNLPISATQGHMFAFDARRCLASVCYPFIFLSSADRDWGLGHAEAELNCPAARWACLDLATDDVLDCKYAEYQYVFMPGYEFRIFLFV